MTMRRKTGEAVPVASEGTAGLAASAHKDPRFCGSRSHDSDDMPREEFLQLSAACDFLEHYHLCHTSDKISRFRGKSDMPDIIVVSDPEWKAKLREFLKSEFPG